jgi:hypothetical protein
MRKHYKIYENMRRDTKTFENVNLSSPLSSLLLHTLALLPHTRPRLSGGKSATDYAPVSCIHTMRITLNLAIVEQTLSTSFIGMKGPVMKD